MFTQILDPAGNLFITWLVALIPVVSLLFMLAALRWSAWVATLIGSLITLALGLWVWQMPFKQGIRAYIYGSATGVWNVDWITFWGVMLFNTLVITGTFDKLRRWLISQGTQDVRVQTILFAWAFGALLEGLVGFGYPWAFVAPILIALGIPDLDAIRVAAIANNAPVSYGALGAPIIALAAVTGYPLLALSGSISKIVALLALLPPWILLYLVSGRKGMWGAWPGDRRFTWIHRRSVAGRHVSWPVPAGCLRCDRMFHLHPAPAQGLETRAGPRLRWPADQRRVNGGRHGLSGGDIFQAWLPIAVLVVVVVAWTGPWSQLPGIVLLHLQVTAASSISQGATIAAIFNWTPFVGGSAILVSWIIVALLLRVSRQQLAEIWTKTWSRCGAPASSVCSSLASPMSITSRAWRPRWRKPSPCLAQALSSWRRSLASSAWLCRAATRRPMPCSESSRRWLVKFLGFPPLLLPTVNSIGAEIGKPIAPQTASVGVSTTRFVRNEGEVIRHNFGWCLVVLVYLVVISVACYMFFPGIMKL